TQILESQGRFPELVDYLADWVKQAPPGPTAYQQYLSALIRTEQIDKASTLIAQWLKEGQAPGELRPAVASQLSAAVAQALGQGHNLSTNRIDARWLAPLADAALTFARHPSQGNVAATIMGNGQFQQTDDCRHVRKALTDILTRE